MKRTFLFSISAAIALISVDVCNAQAIIALKPAPSGIVIDGKSTEWGDALANTDEVSKLNYTISNDKENLYLVIKTKDPVQESGIAGGGVTLAIDIKGRKKSSFAVTFPSFPPEKDQSSYMTIDPETFGNSLKFFNKYGKLKAEGFKDIDEAEMPADNSYGIKTATSFDANGYLVYEEAIPLTLFNAGDLINKEWAYIITINPLHGKGQPGMAGSTTEATAPKKRGARKSIKDISASIPSSGAGQELNELTPEVSFWGKFTLVK